MKNLDLLLKGGPGSGRYPKGSGKKNEAEAKSTLNEQDAKESGKSKNWLMEQDRVMSTARKRLARNPDFNEDKDGYMVIRSVKAFADWVQSAGWPSIDAFEAEMQIASSKGDDLGVNRDNVKRSEVIDPDWDTLRPARIADLIGKKFTTLRRLVILAPKVQ